MSLYAHHQDIPENPTEYEVASSIQAQIRCLDDPDKQRPLLDWARVKIRVHKVHKKTRIEVEVPSVGS